MRYDFLANLWRGEIWVGLLALAVFLVFTWVLRGAPPGQAAALEDDESAPKAGYRDRVVIAVVFGLLLILAGAYIALARNVLWSLPVFGFGFALVISLVAHNRRYRHASPSLRRTIELSTAFLNAALLAGILVVVNVIAFRYGGQPWDITREGTYTLESRSLNEIKTLARPLTFIMVFGRGALAVRQHDRVLQLLEAYKAANPAMVKLENLDPFSDLPRTDELTRRVPDLELLHGTHGGGVVVEYGEGDSAEYVVVRNQDLFMQSAAGPGRSGSDRFVTRFSGEDEITSAIMRLREGKKTKIGFTTGHGEPSTSDLNPRGRGVGSWKARFTKVGCEVIDLQLMTDLIPKDLSLLVIVGPRSSFKPEEVLKLRSYADRGGPFLLLLGNSEPSGLEAFLQSFNLEIGRGVVLDRKYNYRNLSLVVAPLSANVNHPIVAPLGASRAVLLPGAAPIQIAGIGPRPAGESSGSPDPSLVPAPIVYTSPFSWAETEPRAQEVRFDPKTDVQGPLTVGVAVATRAANQSTRTGGPGDGTPRLVLFSCPAMAENAFVETERTNLDLLMNAASWLRGKPDTLGIDPAGHIALTLAIDPTLRSRLILVPTVTACLLIIAIGIVVYTARRE
jgi:ABC-type uncharacterized transport system